MAASVLKADVYLELRRHTGSVTAVAANPTGGYVTGSNDESLCIWDAFGNLKKMLPGHIGGINSVAFAGDGRNLIAGCGDSSVRLWDVLSAEDRGKLKSHNGDVLGVAISSRGDLIASCGRDQVALVYNSSNGKIAGVLKGHSGAVKSVVFSPDGHSLVTGGEDSNLIVWDLKTFNILGVLHGHTKEVNCISFASTGEYLASGGADAKLIVWKGSDGSIAANLGGHTASICSIAYSPHADIIASGSMDHTVRIIDAEDYHLLAVLEPQRGNIYSISWNPKKENNFLNMIIGTDSHSQVWRIDYQSAAAKALEEQQTVRGVIKESLKKLHSAFLSAMELHALSGQQKNPNAANLLQTVRARFESTRQSVLGISKAADAEKELLVHETLQRFTASQQSRKGDDELKQELQRVRQQRDAAKQEVEVLRQRLKNMKQKAGITGPGSVISVRSNTTDLDRDFDVVSPDARIDEIANKLWNDIKGEEEAVVPRYGRSNTLAEFNIEDAAELADAPSFHGPPITPKNDLQQQDHQQQQQQQQPLKAETKQYTPAATTTSYPPPPPAGPPPPLYGSEMQPPYRSSHSVASYENNDSRSVTSSVYENPADYKPLLVRSYESPYAQRYGGMRDSLSSLDSRNNNNNMGNNNNNNNDNSSTTSSNNRFGFSNNNNNNNNAKPEYRSMYQPPLQQQQQPQQQQPDINNHNYNNNIHNNSAPPPPPPSDPQPPAPHLYSSSRFPSYQVPHSGISDPGTFSSKRPYEVDRSDTRSVSGDAPGSARYAPVSRLPYENPSGGYNPLSNNSSNPLLNKPSSSLYGSLNNNSMDSPARAPPPPTSSSLNNSMTSSSMPALRTGSGYGGGSGLSSFNPYMNAGLSSLAMNSRLNNSYPASSSLTSSSYSRPSLNYANL